MKKIFNTIYTLFWKSSIIKEARKILYWVDYFILLTIPKPSKNNSNKKKVLVVFNLAMGDCIMYSGIIESYRKIYNPDNYELTIVCQKHNGILFENKFDNIIEIDVANLSLSISGRRKIFKLLREEYYDIIIDPIGPSIDSCTYLMTRAIIGKEKKGVYCKDKISKEVIKADKIYDNYIEIDKIDGKHRIELYAEFLRKLGDEVCIAHPANIIFQNAINSNVESKLPNDFYIVYPSASVNTKCWPISRYAEIVEKIYAKTKLPLVVCGTEHDKENVDKMISYISKDIPIINIIGETSIKGFIECIGRAKFVITNDTSTYHIAIAKRVKTFILAGGYTFDSFVNYNYSKIGYIDPIIINKDMECYNCELNCRYNVKDVFPCIDKITVEHAWNIIDKNI